DLKDGRQLWTYEIGPEIHSSPGISNGMVFVGADDGFVYAFGAAR
ncbi:MAG: PQQ-like domain, partial [Armatimonadetes bacterium]|nr:PQQ-like domain [Armatimonadota bacterium]